MGGDGSIPTNKCFIIAQKISVRPAPLSKCKWEPGRGARRARYTDEGVRRSVSLRMMWRQRERPGCG